MATTKDYLDFVCTQLEGIRGVDYKRMFGEYQIYVNDRPVLLVCDNTVFVKNHPALAHLLAEAPEGLPYPGAKPQKILDVDEPCADRAGSGDPGARHARLQTPGAEDLRYALA